MGSAIVQFSEHLNIVIHVEYSLKLTLLVREVLLVQPVQIKVQLNFDKDFENDADTQRIRVKSHSCGQRYNTTG